MSKTSLADWKKWVGGGDVCGLGGEGEEGESVLFTKWSKRYYNYKANEAKIMQDDTFIYTEQENSWQRADM